MGYDFDELFPNRFLKAGQFKGKIWTLTIAGIRIEEMPSQDKKKGPQTKGIISFRETKKELVLNRTNGESLKAMFGRATDAWIGKRVSFCPKEVEAFGEATLAIRVFGSPDLERDMRAQLKLGQKSVSALLKKTAPGAPVKPEANGDAEPFNDHDPETGEVSLDQ